MGIILIIRFLLLQPYKRYLKCQLEMKLLQGSPYMYMYKIYNLSQDPHVSSPNTKVPKYKSWIDSERTLRGIALTPASKQPAINQSVGGWARQLSEWGRN